MKTNFFISAPVFKVLVYANVFISICALAQVFVTYSIFPIPVNFQNNSYLVFVFLSTYLQYNVQRGYAINSTNAHSERSQWLIKYKKLMFYSIGACLITVLFLCNNLSYTSIAIMVGAEVFSTLYYLPPVNLRKHGYIKPFLISMIWVISCSLVPLIENRLFTLNSLWFLASQFFFIATLCMLFDIKDAEDDYLAGVNTYANKLGIRTTKLICILCVVVAAICFYYFKPTNRLLIPGACMFVITNATVLFTSQKHHNFYYYLWIDGLLVLQAILFLIWT